jgi:hypothetical protein
MLNAENARSEDDFSGSARPAPGRYHMAINHAEEKGSKKKGTPGLELEFQVICDGLCPDGKTKTTGQSGRTIPLFLSYVGADDAKTETCLNRVARLALCCGVLKPGEAKEPDWQEAMGRELVIEVEAQEYDDANGNKKSGSQVAFMGFWSLGNKEVANVPKDHGTPGMKNVVANGGGNGPAKSAAATAPQTSTTTKPRSKFSDL